MSDETPEWPPSWEHEIPAASTLPGNRLKRYGRRLLWIGIALYATGSALRGGAP